MRKFSFICVVSLLALMALIPCGCSDKKPAPVAVRADTAVADTSHADSSEAIIAETPMPKAADELFDDFIFNFAANKRLQYRRINFPLPVLTNGKKTSEIQRANWRMEHFFMRQDYYSLLFDNKKQMDVVKDTSISHVVIEKIYLRKKTVKQYIFDRENGQFRMTAINIKPMYQNKNASFWKFYQRFASDSAFQVRHVANPVKFTGPDPDDDFSTMTGDIAPETWPAFAPKLPHKLVYNIIYGQKYEESNQKIFVMRGIANGFETELTFKQVHGKWMLIRLNT